MKVLVIGRPSYNTILPVDGMPDAGKSYLLKEKYISVGGNSVYAAIMLASFGVDVSFSGVIGSDNEGNNIKNILEGYKVDTKFLEISYEKKTILEYSLINKQTNEELRFIDNTDMFLTKYKYDFVPDVIVTDGSDISGALAAFNNYPTSKKILLATLVNNDVYNLSKKCDVVIANLAYANALTKTVLNLKNNKDVVNFYQKIRDLNNADYVVNLLEDGILYSNNNEVKLLPKNDVVMNHSLNYLGAFLGAYVYGYINNYDKDSIVKIASLAGALSCSNSYNLNVPDLNNILNTLNLKKTEVLETINEEVK